MRCKISYNNLYRRADLILGSVCESDGNFAYWNFREISVRICLLVSKLCVYPQQLWRCIQYVGGGIRKTIIKLQLLISILMQVQIPYGSCSKYSYTPHTPKKISTPNTCMLYNHHLLFNTGCILPFPSNDKIYAHPLFTANFIDVIQEAKFNVQTRQFQFNEGNLGIGCVKHLREYISSFPSKDANADTKLSLMCAMTEEIASSPTLRERVI